MYISLIKTCNVLLTKKSIKICSSLFLMQHTELTVLEIYTENYTALLICSTCILVLIIS